MARDFFNNLPDTTTPLTAPRLNALLDGDEAMGNILVDTIRTKNLFNINGEVNIQGNSGSIVSGNSVSGNVLTTNINGSGSHGAGQKFTDLNGKTITFSAKCISNGTGTGVNIIIYDNNVQKAYKMFSNGQTNYLTYTATSDNVVLAFSTVAGTGAQLTDIQVEIGSSKTDYAEYQGLGYVSGSNANGSYIKYDDGTLICYHKKQFSGVNITTTNGSLYTATLTYPFEFPISFIEEPVLNVTVQDIPDFSYCFPYIVRRNIEQIISIVLLRPSAVSNATTKVGYIAIGRWK